MKMFIAPVSSLNFRNNTPVNFSSKRESDKEAMEYITSQKNSTTDLSKMPVIVLLAMAPSLTQAKPPEIYSELNPSIKTEIVSSNDVIEDAGLISLQELQQIQQSKAPYGWESLKYENINYVQNFKMDNKNYTLLFTSSAGYNNARSVYIITEGAKGSKHSEDIPPEVRNLVHHDIGEGDFCGAIIDRDIRSSDTDKYMGTLRQEIRLPDEVAQKIVDLVTGHSQFENQTSIKIKTVNTPELLATKFYE